MDCIFCAIVAGEVPSDILHETDRIVAFRDIAPKAPTHILLIPKTHIDSARDLTEKDAAMLGEIYSAAAHLANAEGIFDKGYRVATNAGKEGGQIVDHLHFHLLGGRQMAPELG